MKPSLLSRLRPFIFVCVGLIALLGGGYLYQQISEQNDRRAYPPIGALIDVGGYRLHLYCVGEGSPTVILMHGLGGNIYHWAQIQPALATTTRVCAFDRAGYGWSESGPLPRSLQQNAKELHMLLTNAGITDALILVGHSYGTNLAQVYTDEYPENVRGIVLIDGGIAAEVIKQCPALNCMPPIAKSGADMFIGLQPFLMRFGVLRLMGFPQPYGDNLKYLAAEQRAALLAGSGHSQNAETNLSEWQNWETQIGQVGQPNSLNTIPVRVFMADEELPDWAYGSEPEKWRGYQEALLTELTWLSSDSQVIVRPNSDHASMLFKQDQWQPIVDTITTLIEANRTH